MPSRAGFTTPTLSSSRIVGQSPLRGAGTSDYERPWALWLVAWQGRGGHTANGRRPCHRRIQPQNVPLLWRGSRIMGCPI